MTCHLLLKGSGPNSHIYEGSKIFLTLGSSDKKPKFGMYFGVPSHEEYGLWVVTMGIIQGGIYSDGIHTVYAQEVKDSEGTFCWTTTKTCAWCNHVFSNGESAMNHMRTHYRIVLVCPFCAICGSHSYPSMRDHVKKCKGDYSELLESSDAQPRKYEPCFRKGDKHLPKEGLASCTRFTYKLDDKQVNTKTIQQLIDEFKARAEKEVTAVHQACALCGKHSGPATVATAPRSPYMMLKQMPKGLQISRRNPTHRQLLLPRQNLLLQQLSAKLPKIPISLRSRTWMMMS